MTDTRISPVSQDVSSLSPKEGAEWHRLKGEFLRLLLNRNPKPVRHDEIRTQLYFQSKQTSVSMFQTVKDLANEYAKKYLGVEIIQYQTSTKGKSYALAQYAPIFNMSSSFNSIEFDAIQGFLTCTMLCLCILHNKMTMGDFVLFIKDIGRHDLLEESAMNQWREILLGPGAQSLKNSFYRRDMNKPPSTLVEYLFLCKQRDYLAISCPKRELRGKGATHCELSEMSLCDVFISVGSRLQYHMSNEEAQKLIFNQIGQNDSPVFYDSNTRIQETPI